MKCSHLLIEEKTSYPNENIDLGKKQEALLDIQRSMNITPEKRKEDTNIFVKKSVY